MALLAWLMVVVTSLTAAPLGAVRHPAHAARTTVVTADECCHHDTHAKTAQSCTDHVGGCGGSGGHACGCAAMGASMLPSVVASIATAMIVALRYGTPDPGRALASMTAPPLRPPAV
jgi:hypothetical protein